MTDPSGGQSPQLAQDDVAAEDTEQSVVGRAAGDRPEVGEDGDQPGTGNPERPRGNRKRLIVGLLVLALAVIGGVAGGIAYLTNQDDGPSDERKIELAVRDYYTDLNSGGWEAALGSMCASSRAPYEALPEDGKAKVRVAKFEAVVNSVEIVEVDGDMAKVSVGGTFTTHLNDGGPQRTVNNTVLAMVKEDGDWLMCGSVE